MTREYGNDSERVVAHDVIDLMRAPQAATRAARTGAHFDCAPSDKEGDDRPESAGGDMRDRAQRSGVRPVGMTSLPVLDGPPDFARGPAHPPRYGCPLCIHDSHSPMID